jgi:hypothetical protein
MSKASVALTGMTAILAVLMASLTMALGHGVLMALLAYSVGGSFCLFTLSASALLQQAMFSKY